MDSKTNDSKKIEEDVMPQQQQQPQQQEITPMKNAKKSTTSKKGKGNNAADATPPQPSCPLKRAHDEIDNGESNSVVAKKKTKHSAESESKPVIKKTKEGKNNVEQTEPKTIATEGEVVNATAAKVSKGKGGSGTKKRSIKDIEEKSEDIAEVTNGENASPPSTKVKTSKKKKAAKTPATKTNDDREEPINDVAITDKPATSAPPAKKARRSNDTTLENSAKINNSSDTTSKKEKKTKRSGGSGAVSGTDGAKEKKSQFEFVTVNTNVGDDKNENEHSDKTFYEVEKVDAPNKNLFVKVIRIKSPATFTIKGKNMHRIDYSGYFSFNDKTTKLQIYNDEHLTANRGVEIIPFFLANNEKDKSFSVTLWNRGDHKQEIVSGENIAVLVASNF